MVMLVSDLMHAHPVSIQKDTPLLTAAKLLESLDVRHLPVLDGSRLVGMLSDRDLGSVLDESFLEPGSPRSQQPVSRVMTADVATIAVDAAASDAAELIVEHKVGALPVVRDGKTLVGIISYVDLLRALSEVA